MGQGFVAEPRLAASLHSPCLAGALGGSHAAMTRWAGSAMHVAAVGSVLLWIAAYGEPAVVSPPPCPSGSEGAHVSLIRSATGLSLASPPLTPCSTGARLSTSRSATRTSRGSLACPPYSDTPLGAGLPVELQDVPPFPFRSDSTWADAGDAAVDSSSGSDTVHTNAVGVLLAFTACLSEDPPSGARASSNEHKPRARDVFPLPAFRGGELVAIGMTLNVPNTSVFGCLV